MNWFKRNKSPQPELVTTNQFTVQVPKCTGTRYIISDVHGCLKTLVCLVEKLKLKPEDQLFLLGDYIDRGSDSRGVLDYLIDLQKHYSVFALKGNHEDDIESMEEANNEKLFANYLEAEPDSIVNSDFSVDVKYQHFIANLPYYIELENHFLVHAGFNFKRQQCFEDTDDMLWIRRWNYDAKKAKNKTIIHGHTVNNLTDIKRNIARNEKIIPLDNGCFFAGAVGHGNLLCLNLNTNELIIQENIENN